MSSGNCVASKLALRTIVGTAEIVSRQVLEWILLRAL